MEIKSKKFFILIFVLALFSGLLSRFSFVRLVTFNEAVPGIDAQKGDQALVLIKTQPKSGWVVFHYPDYSSPYIIRKVVGGDIEQGSVEIPGNPLVSVVKNYGEILVVDGTKDSKLGDSRSWGKGVDFDLVLGRVLFHIPKGDVFKIFKWKRPES